MEPLPRPHHRRKHSAAPNAFPVVGTTPYDDVLVSRGGRGAALQVHEYAEIFAGSTSSIPVLDLLDVDGRVDAQISLRDYANIFGGLRNDDVAAPYDELFNGSVKRAKPRTRANFKPPLRQSGSLLSSVNTRKPTNETSNQSVGEVKQHFNVSFNKTNQRDNDASDGKTHIAELDSVSGFTYFVDEAPRQKKTEERQPVLPLKRDVSRTWSFSGEVKDVKGKHGVSSDKSREPDMSHNWNEANVKLHSSKVPASSNRPLTPCNSKDPRDGRRASNLTSKADASKKIADEYTSPLLDEELDENSAAAASAAALKKAIEQAQESIRLAKFIMEKKKAGHDHRSKSGSYSLPKDLDKKTEVEHEVHDSMPNSSKEKCVMLSAKPVEIDGKCNPSFGEIKMHPNAGSAAVETVWEKVEATKENGEQFGTSSSNQSGGICLDANVQLSGDGKNVEAAALASEMLGSNNGMKPSIGKLSPAIGRIETGKETLKQKIAVNHTGPEVERYVNTSQRMQDLEESVVELELHQATFDEVRTPEISGEPVEKIVDKDKNWRISLRKEVVETREDNVHDIEQHDAKFEESMEVHRPLQLPTMESMFSVFLKESRNLIMGNAVLEQEKMKSNLNDASDCKENEHNDKMTSHEGGNKMRWEEAHLSLEGEEHLEVVSKKDEEINVRELGAHPKMGTTEKKVEGCEPEIEKKQKHSEDGDEPQLPGELDQDKVEERDEDIIEGGATESQLMEAINLARDQVSEEDFGMWKHQMLEADYFAESQKDESFWDEEETNSTLRGMGRSEDCYEERHEDTFVPEADVIQVTEANIFEEVQKNDPVWDVEETNSPLSGDGGSQNNDEERFDYTSECEVQESQSMEADVFTEGPKNGAFFTSCKTISSRTGRFEEHHSEERPEITSENIADKSQELEANKFAEVQKKESFGDVDTSSTVSGMGRSEELNYAVEADYEHVNADMGDEPQENCENLNSTTEQHQKTVNRNMENDTVCTVGGSQTYKNMEAEELFHLEESEIPGIDSLRRIASEEIFVESKQSNASEGPSDSKKENAGVTDSDSTENSSVDVNVFKTDSEIRGTAQYYADDNLSDAISSDSRNEEFDLSDERPVLEQTSETDEGSVSTSIPEDFDRSSTHEPEDCSETLKDVTPNNEEMLNEPEVSNETKFSEEQSEGCSQFQNGPKGAEAKKCKETSSNIEKNLDPVGSVATEKRDAKATMENFERQQRIEVIKRAREREKEKLAVERVIREARERAFAEAQKSAAEKAAAGAQQRVRTETQEKPEKAAAVKQPVDKTSSEAKLRAERAAVERALAEVRGRALEKALSQKTSTETRTSADRSNALKHSFSSSDLENSTATESAQRRKARLERHQRIMERAAKALAEKNKRDILAQKEQAERERLADSLDADIKRWATGKEGNLRALLSTLQYILGRDSGWQPIPLTEIVTTAAVKKAYRKATLYVHPDKLQQRGASIRQSYICEKVFDLLKAAWNKFIAEER